MPRLVSRYNPKIVIIESDFASLRNVYTIFYRELYRYEIDFDVDQIAAIKNNVLTATVSLYLSRPPRERSLLMIDPTRDNFTRVRSSLVKPSKIGITTQSRIRKARKNKPHQLIRNLQLRSSLRKDARKRRKSSAILTVKVDFTAFFDNTVVKMIRRASRMAALRALKPRRKVTLRTVRSIKNSNKRAPLLKVQNVRYKTKTRRTPRAAAISLILKNAVDPASIYHRQKSIQSTKRAIGGLVMRRKPRVRATKSQIKPLLMPSSLRLSTVNKRPNLNDASLVPVVIFKSDPNVNVKKRLYITDKMLMGKSSFYLKFDVKNVFGKTVYSTTRKVAHSRQVAALNTPRRSPSMLFSPYRRPGKNVLEIRQNDKIAEKIILYRKAINRVAGRLIDSKFERAGVLRLVDDDGTEKFTDIVDNSKTYIYRAVPIGPNGEVGIMFASVVARGIPIRGSKLSQKITACSVVTELGPLGINIAVSSLPIGPIAVKVMRRDMTIHEKDFKIINDPDPIRLLGDEIILFTSTDVKEDHIYEFVAVLIFEDGDEEVAPSVSHIQYDAIKTNVVETRTSDISLVDGPGDTIEVSFNVKTKIIPGELDVIKRALEDQDLLSEFSDVLKEERGDLQKLITHTITRVDISSGQEEHLGLFVSGKFSDAAAARLSGASPVKSGRSYRYTISPQLRSAETMFKSLKVKKQDPITGKEYSYRPSKFRNPMVLRRGVIMSSGKSSRITAKNNFELGSVGSPIYLTIDIPPNEPTIRGLRASKLDRDTVEISWSLTGDADRIDHFIVQAVKLDEIEFIGAAHNASDSNNFKFYDELDETDQEIFYRIRMVYSDYRRSEVMISNKVVV